METAKQPRPGGTPFPSRPPILRHLGTRLCAGIATAFAVLFLAASPATSAAEARREAVVIAIKGTAVEILPAGETTWQPARTNQSLVTGDTVRTGEHCRALLRLPDDSIVPLDELTTTRLGIPERSGVLELLRGILSFFHRDRPGSLEVRSGSISAIVKGTEFVFAAPPAGPTSLTLIDGAVSIAYAPGAEATYSATPAEPIVLTITPGAPPQRTAVLTGNAVEAVQWFLYYPGVIDVQDLELPADVRGSLAESLRLLEAGDPLGALAAYPAGRAPASAAEQVLHAALVLSVGNVDQARRELAALPQDARSQRIAAALQRVIAAVQLRPCEPEGNDLIGRLPTEWLALSYCRQSAKDLAGALAAARSATVASPRNGYAWARVAELEFSFGRRAPAEAALQKALLLSPRNAQAHALNGFLLAGAQKNTEAMAAFETAISLDPGLGNAWLGRGLTRIRKGDAAGGRADLMVAAAIEPQRALFRSYLGKAYSAENDAPRARHELELAKQADPKDPTPWLYNALELDAENRVNEAIDELEAAQSRGGNRGIYRSELLLDQDRAVRSANLARIYRKADMPEVGLREAIKGVNSDYTSFSSHLFLAETYDYLRDPNLADLRYETAAVSEYLIANLLAPVGAGVLSPTISQGEYSSLFERSRIGVVSQTEYSSNGDWLQSGTVHGIGSTSAFAIEGFYRSLAGFRPNNDSEQQQVAVLYRQQVTPEDSFFARVATLEIDAGDLSRSAGDAGSSPTLRSRETQRPQVSLGYHHEWSPESHTLLFAQGIREDAGYSEPSLLRPALVRPLYLGDPVGFYAMQFNEEYSTQIEGYAVELQQLVEHGHWTFIAGGRVQWGAIDVQAIQTIPNFFEPYFPPPPGPAASATFDESYIRGGAYGYALWQVLPSLRVIGGLSYDTQEGPANFRSPPLSPGRTTRDRINPKAGLIWNITPTTTFRSAYTSWLTGAGPDQSYQIEPSQVAGFAQAYRSAIPDYLTGTLEGTTVESMNFSLEHRFPSRTYVALGGELRQARADRTRGGYAFEFESSDQPTAQLIQFGERIRYRDRGLTATLNQLLGNNLSLGVGYRFAASELDNEFPTESFPLIQADTAFNDSPVVLPNHRESRLHQLSLSSTYNHSCGGFATMQGLWTGEDLAGDGRGVEGFWQLNLLAGWRFPRNRGELSVGVLNVTDEQKFATPLTTHNAPPRERMFIARLTISF